MATTMTAGIRSHVRKATNWSIVLSVLMIATGIFLISLVREPA